MDPKVEAIFLKAQSFFKDMAGDVMMIYAEKGFEPFKKPLMIAGPSLLVLYAAVYSPLTGKVSSTSNQLESMKVVAQYAGDYEDAKTRLAAYQRRLPFIKDKDEWLNYVITTTARAYGISFDSLSAQKETEVGNYLVVSREVMVTTTYANLGRWIAEIENSKILLRVTDLTIRRSEDNPGTVKVTFTLATVFSKFGGGG
jgi:type II secretory pathway component PulM